MTNERDRIETGRAFWSWAIVGAIAAWTTGAAYAWYFEHTAGWQHGIPWEIALLHVTHVHLPNLVDSFLLLLPWLGTNITILPGVAIASYMFTKRRRGDLRTSLIVAAAGNYLVGFGLKYAFDRPRPRLWQSRGEYTGPSFPSGHAMMATSVLFVIAYLLHRERGWRWPYVVSALFGVLTIFSRLYLGVHWPTDVFIGTAVGAVWLAAMLKAMNAEPSSRATIRDVPRSTPSAVAPSRSSPARCTPDRRAE